MTTESVHSNVVITYPPRKGFLLYNLELYNWGTFNSSIFRITPAGATSLLTGANGSGKSTIVDALLTLLVPNIKRNYNLASGSEQKRERDEKSYVLGAWGRKREADSSISKVEYLRSRDTYSILLAHFHDETNNQDVTLAQVFYFQNDSLEKFQIASGSRLDISADFSGFSTVKDLRKKIRSIDGTEVFDNFTEYSAAFRRLLGIESEKAVDLFNQTVSIKEIGNLNDFIRKHMLERPGIESRIASLRKNFNNLDAAHKAIIRAREQLEKLRPIVTLLDNYDSTAAAVTECEELSRVIPRYFAEIKIKLIKDGLTVINEKLDSVRKQLLEYDKRAEEKQEEEIRIRQAIEQDADSLRLNELVRESQTLEKQLLDQKQQAERYAELAAHLELKTEPTGAQFVQNREQSVRKADAHAELIAAVQGQRDQAVIILSTKRREESELSSEVESLLARSSRIPAKYHKARALAAGALGLREEDIPFAGELIKVKESCTEYAPIIEFILRRFALTVIVPPEHLKPFLSYINKEDSPVEFSCMSWDAVMHSGEDQISDNDTIASMLEVNPRAGGHTWLVPYLNQEFNTVFVKSVEGLLKNEKTVTQKALLHSRWNHFTKSSSSGTSTHVHSVLGWDNREKTAMLTEQLREITNEITLQERNISLLSSRAETIRIEAERLRDILTFTDYEKINVKYTEAELKKKQQHIRDLEKSSDRLNTLRTQLAHCREEYKVIRLERDNCTKSAANLERDQKELTVLDNECAVILEDRAVEISPAHRNTLSLACKENTVTVKNASKIEKEITADIHAREREHNRVREQIEKRLLLAMERFTHAWPEDTADVDAHIRSGPAFRMLHERLEGDDLPRYEKQFKELLDEKVILDVSGFYNCLIKESEQIHEKIDELNTALAQINYTYNTYIRLNCEKTPDTQVREFQLMLRDSFEGLGTKSDPERNEQGFLRIKKIIERFDTDEYWTKKVTDVRNWLEFSASERYRETNEEKSFYSDSSGKSGGQKAKLAYTILASAISYQYGIHRDDFFSRSFRFAVIDEAFSKSDEANSRYAMELFKTLGLQILVVSPLDKTQVVEPYIDACHLVTNNEMENSSEVYNITMDEYFSEKKKKQ